MTKGRSFWDFDEDPKLRAPPGLLNEDPSLPGRPRESALMTSSPGTPWCCLKFESHCARKTRDSQRQSHDWARSLGEGHVQPLPPPGTESVRQITVSTQQDDWESKTATKRSQPRASPRAGAGQEFVCSPPGVVFQEKILRTAQVLNKHSKANQMACLIN